jgi:hypothetical protein
MKLNEMSRMIHILSELQQTLSKVYDNTVEFDLKINDNGIIITSDMLGYLSTMEFREILDSVSAPIDMYENKIIIKRNK